MNNQAARIFFAVVLLLLSPALVVAQSNTTDKPFVKQPSGKQPLAHTYSVVARDPETNQLGVAVQSHWFSVGASRETLSLYKLLSITLHRGSEFSD